MINDLIFTTGSIIFLFALVPSILSKDKPAKKTSIMTSLVLFAFTFNYISLGLYISSVLGFITGVCWFILYIQVVKREKNESNFST
jgi:hypothetical protein